MTVVRQFSLIDCISCGPPIDERTIRDFTDSERAYLAIFERLRDTVDAIPTSLIEAAEQRYVALGPVGYEEAMIANVQAIECQTPPKDTAEFLTTFDAGLRPAGLVFAAEHAQERMATQRAA